MQRIFLWTRKMSPTKTWAKNWAISGLLGHIHFSPLPEPPENFYRGNLRNFRCLREQEFDEVADSWVRSIHVWCVNSLRYFSRLITLLRPSTCNVLVGIYLIHVCCLSHCIMCLSQPDTDYSSRQPPTRMACSSEALGTAEPHLQNVLLGHSV